MIWTEKCFEFLRNRQDVCSCLIMCVSLFRLPFIVSGPQTTRVLDSEQTPRILGMTAVQEGKVQRYNHSPGSWHQHLSTKTEICNSYCGYQYTWDTGVKVTHILLTTDWTHTVWILNLLQGNITLCLTEELPVFFILIQKTHTQWLRVTTEFKCTSSPMKSSHFFFQWIFVSNTKWYLEDTIKSAVRIWLRSSLKFPVIFTFSQKSQQAHWMV